MDTVPLFLSSVGTAYAQNPPRTLPADGGLLLPCSVQHQPSNRLNPHYNTIPAIGTNQPIILCHENEGSVLYCPRYLVDLP